MKGVAFTTRSIRFHAPKGREARKKIYKLISMSTVQSSSYTGFENCPKSLILSDDSFRYGPTDFYRMMSSHGQTTT